MTALSQARMGREFSLAGNVSLPLAASTAVYQDGMACIDTTNHVVTKGAAGNTSLIRIGNFAENYDNSASTATAMVLVSLDYEVKGRWYANDTGANAVAAANLFTEVYMLDDQTVTTASSTNSKAGRVWAIDSVKGVAVAESKNV